MKLLRAALLASSAVLVASAFAEPARASVSFEFAYSNLSQHGSWLVSAQYGRVWQPREYARDWNPYYDGHWVDTDMGWTWVSDYGWGSIPYHYGTWYVDPRYGWVWIPGEIWAPSWVVFRTSPQYIGWYPVPPGFSVGISMEFGSPSNFVYVSSRDFLAPRLRGSIIPPERTNVFVSNTTVVNNIVIQNNIVINRGPDVASIERATGHAVRRQSIDQVARVAPFEHVTREQLAVAPDRAKGALRVAEPVPESRPLPTADQRGQPNKQQQKDKSPVSAPKHDQSAKAHDRQQPPAREAAPVTPADPKGQQQPAHKSQADVKAQPAQPPPHEQAATVAQKPKSSQPAHNASPVTPPKQAQQSPPPSKTEADAAKHDASTNATTPQKAKPPAKDKTKKDNPDKQDKEPGKDNPPPPNE